MAFLIFGYDLTQTLLHLPTQPQADPTLGVEGDAGKREELFPEGIGHLTDERVNP